MQLKRAVRHILEERDWWRLPRYFVGSSSGGAAALLFATRFPVQVKIAVRTLQGSYMYIPVKQAHNAVVYLRQDQTNVLIRQNCIYFAPCCASASGSSQLQLWF